MHKMGLSELCRLAWRQLWREFKAGELRILWIALMLTVTISTAIGYFGTRLQGSMNARAGEFLAADLVVRGSMPLNAAQVAMNTEGLTHAHTVNFSTVVFNDDDMQLVSIKAADSHYPLRGTLTIELPESSTPVAIDQGPARGEIWVENRLLYALNLTLGQTIEIGQLPLRISNILVDTPDRAGGFYSLNPFGLMNIDDLAATGAVQPGSRVTHRDLWAGDADAIDRLHQALSPTLAPHQSLLTPKDGNEQINGALSRAQTYLNLASLVGILLSSVAIALAANQFAARRYDDSALLRALGMPKNAVLALYGMMLMYLGIMGAIIGAVFGYGVQWGLLALLSNVIKGDLPAGGLLPAISGMSTGLIVLLGFALPPLAALGRTPPIRVLREDAVPVPFKNFVVYGLAIAALFLIMWQLSLNLMLTLALLGGALLMVLVLGFVLYGVVRLLRKSLQSASFIWRMALGETLRHPMRSMGQMVAFGIILMTMALVLMLRSELLQDWREQLPKDAANHFALNIAPLQKDDFAKALGEQASNVSPFYPVVMGRLTAVNGHNVKATEFVSDRAKNAIDRDLNLTWSEDLPKGNEVVAGQWWPSIDVVNGVSLDADLAQGLGVMLNDTLTFVIAGQARDYTVTSLRSIDWQTIEPNFFVIFAPDSMKDAPVTYLTSFYWPEGQTRALIEVMKGFPTVTLLDLQALITQLNDILQQVTLAIEYILVLVLAAGIVVLLAGLQTTLAERLKQGAILRVLGANRRILLKSQGIEFALMGGLSGLLAVLGSELISYLLYHYLLDLSWQPHIRLWLLPLMGAMLITAMGMLSARSVTQVSPLTILRG
ncbi:ABC transporter permease [Wohlfahrtiimonas chitiniclastica]|uniref:ABC transporter permease n=1 Tax=Wohlfahrtiimonas chitiniclastica TaxID=400946 RepID=UPI000B99CD52|nr:FtsX-like permease family protein [Wohlfahrtiimonas chitiniclastica]OYQ87438.1 ABC transporter permease [Wohlfahrtiimonas chitiniclastica]